MSYATGIILFRQNEPPFFLLLAGTKARCKEFSKERNLSKKTIFVLTKASFKELDPAECRILLGPNFYKNRLYRDADWQRFYRKVMGLGELTDEFIQKEKRLDELKKAKKRR